MRLTALLVLISASYATARLNPPEGSLSREEKRTVGKVTFESDEELRDFIKKRESTIKSQVNKKKDQVGLSVSKGDATCKDSPEGWFDSGGDTFDCEYYEVNEKCDEWGYSFAGVDGKVATEACCACGGGETNICTDSPMGWFDGLGSTFDCHWYAQGDRCEIYGNDTPNLGKTANEACCACGGGSTPSNDPVCSDTIDGWEDSLGDDCDWYADPNVEVSRCYLYGNSFANQGATANEVCCACGGGSGGNDDPFSGYDFYANLDSSGGDIFYSDKDSISEYAEECDALSHCKGFNTNGWIKHTIRPGREWTNWGSSPEQGLYVKKTEFESLTEDETEKLKNVSKKDRDEIKSFDDLKKYVAKAE